MGTWDYNNDMLDTAGEPTTAQVWERLRAHRNRLLRDADYRVLPDAPGDVAAWRAYRKALRDLP
jgi:hypothetical protein